MFEFITNSEERGQVGIGTLIVFIAMVLVAAIAAGVLINTAGFLQTQAEETGEDSTDLVSERIEVSSEVGIVTSTPGDGELSEVRITVSGAPGADQIDLTETTIQAVGPGGQENMVFTVPEIDISDGSPSIPSDSSIAVQSEAATDASQIEVAIGDTVGDDSGDNWDSNTEITIDGTAATTDADLSSDQSGSVITVDVPEGVDTSDGTSQEVSLNFDGGSSFTGSVEFVDTTGGVSELGAGEFAVLDDGTVTNDPVIDNENNFQILLNPNVGALEDTATNPNTPFGEGNSATLDIVSPAGATTQVELRAPDLFDSPNEAVRL